MYIKAITSGAIVAGLLAVSSPAVAANSTPGRCPSDQSVWQLWNVKTQPYAEDNRVDTAGNQNGYVCARPTIVIVEDNGQEFQVYWFQDDVVR
jgi:hypothetical protein